MSFVDGIETGLGILHGVTPGVVVVVVVVWMLYAGDGVAVAAVGNYVFIVDVVVIGVFESEPFDD